jgi:hypothetical protein
VDVVDDEEAVGRQASAAATALVACSKLNVTYA